MSDFFFMHHALALAEEPERSPSPNPRVGAVLVKDGTVISRGFHAGPGKEHAEEMAIREAGDAAEGATLYCTLEPCSHSGCGKHRPPCAPLIVRSGIRRVVIAQLDPNPRVRGNGTAILEAADVEVEVGPVAEDAIRLNAGFNTWMALGRPFIHLKSAHSLDGRTAAADGSSRWITDEEARNHAHRERGRHDAVLVGIGTALTDDPLLTVRAGPARRPYAVVLDSTARLPLSSRLVQERPGETVVVVGPDAPAPRRARLEETGVRVLLAKRVGRPEREASQLDLTDAVAQLSAVGILSIYVESGRRVISSFLKARLYDRVTSYIAPVLIGGPHVGMDPEPASSMDNAVRLEEASVQGLGDQAVVSGYRPGWRASICDAMGTTSRTPHRKGNHVHGTR